MLRPAARAGAGQSAQVRPRAGRATAVNERREFFFAARAEVREVLREKAGGLLQLNEEPEVSEYYQSPGRRPAS